MVELAERIDNVIHAQTGAWLPSTEGGPGGDAGQSDSAAVVAADAAVVVADAAAFDADRRHDAATGPAVRAHSRMRKSGGAAVGRHAWT